MSTADSDDPWYIAEFSPLDPRMPDDFWATLKGLRERCPVAHSTQHGGFWTVTGYENVRRVGQNWQAFSSAESAAPIPFAHDGFKMLPTECDPPMHRSLRKLLDPYFTISAIETKYAQVRAVAVEVMDRFIHRGKCEFMNDFAVAFPALAFFRTVVNLPADQAQECIHWVDVLVFQPERAAEAFGGLAKASAQAFEQRRAAPRRDDVVDALLFGLIDGEREPTELERLQMMANLIIGGMETTANGLGNMTVHLARNPELCAQLAATDDLRPAVEEFLRFEAPLPSFGRSVNRDVEIDGAPIPQGTRIVAVLAAANRDPQIFPDPDQIQIGRPGVGRHVSFGVGPHHCLGIHLAKLEMRIGLQEVLRRMPNLALDTDEPIRYRNAFTRGPNSLPVTFTPDTTVAPIYFDLKK